MSDKQKEPWKGERCLFCRLFRVLSYADSIISVKFGDWSRISVMIVRPEGGSNEICLAEINDIGSRSIIRS